MSTVVLLTACFSPGTDSDEHDAGIQPPSELFGADAGAGGSGANCPSSSPLVSMEIRVRTTTANGRYSPRNIGAIWIETAQGAFVKTIERWAGTRARYLQKFIASSNSNLVDAVTSATLASHTTHDRVWNLTNLMGCEIPVGDYLLRIEMTDKDGAGPSTSIPFTMNDAPMTLNPTETANFHDLLIDMK